MTTESRIGRLREAMARAGLDGVLTFSAEQRRYLTGFTGSNGQVWVDPTAVVLLTDGRYETQAAAEAGGVEIAVYEKLEEEIARRLQAFVGNAGYEGSGVSAQGWSKIAAAAGGVRWQDASACLDELRAIKDAGELARIRRAIAVAESAFAHVQSAGMVGRSEREVALDLEWAIRKAGSERVPFDFIVASAERSALPHGVASRRRIGPGDAVTIDFGAEWDGYYSDMTFSGSAGKDHAWLREICDVLRDAQAAAIAVCRAGAAARDVDRAARNVVERAGYSEAFRHSLGHGVGLAIHEYPRLSQQSEAVLAAGMVITVEPGIYVADRGGARLEDMVLVEQDRARLLTTVEKSYTIWP